MEVIDRDQHEENGCPKVFTVTAVNCFLFQVCLFVCFCLFLFVSCLLQRHFRTGIYLTFL